VLSDVNERVIAKSLNESGGGPLRRVVSDYGQTGSNPGRYTKARRELQKNG
jgi:hypothetical protein